jgi:hypothetical protein
MHTMTTATVHTPSPVATPRGAIAAAWLAAKLVLAFRYVTAPVAVKPRSRISEAAELRAYARHMCDDPRFAADLFAAADRHERGE